MDDSYKSLCGLLTSVKDAYGYNRVYLLYKGVGGKLYTLLDSGYRDNAREGVDYNGPTTQYKPLSGKAKSAIDKVFSKKEPRIDQPGLQAPQGKGAGGQRIRHQRDCQHPVCGGRLEARTEKASFGKCPGGCFFYPFVAM